jgi:hypothetical protein
MPSAPLISTAMSDYCHEDKNGGHEADLRDNDLGDEDAKQIATALMDPSTKF